MTSAGRLAAATLASDGGSRGNPGKAGIGFVLIKDGCFSHDVRDALAYGGAYIGITTNNVAEYSALIWGMVNAAALGVETLTVQADSELIIKQLTGVYKIKNPNMKRLADRVHALEAHFDTVHYRHVYRSQNSLADGLANEGMDTENQRGSGNFVIDALGVDAALERGICSTKQTQPPSTEVFMQDTQALQQSPPNQERGAQNFQTDDSLYPTGPSAHSFQSLKLACHAAKSEASSSSVLPPFLSELYPSEEIALSKQALTDQGPASRKDQDQPPLFELTQDACYTQSCENTFQENASSQRIAFDPGHHSHQGAAMHSLTADPTVILGVTGSIAAYKACEVVRLLKKAGCNVQVVMTEHAQRFVSALTFEELSENSVLTDLFSSNISTNPHITLAQQADAMVVIPATANLIAKLSNGIADDALTSTLLANTAPLLIAPAMNHRMYNHVATQTNLTTLAARGAIIIDPEQGELACGEEGIGCLADPVTIAEAVLEALGR